MSSAAPFPSSCVDQLVRHFFGDASQMIPPPISPTPLSAVHCLSDAEWQSLHTMVPASGSASQMLPGSIFADIAKESGLYDMASNKAQFLHQRMNVPVPPSMAPQQCVLWDSVAIWRLIHCPAFQPALIFLAQSGVQLSTVPCGGWFHLWITFCSTPPPDWTTQREKQVGWSGSVQLWWLSCICLYSLDRGTIVAPEDEERTTQVAVNTTRHQIAMRICELAKSCFTLMPSTGTHFSPVTSVAPKEMTQILLGLYRHTTSKIKSVGRDCLYVVPYLIDTPSWRACYLEIASQLFRQHSPTARTLLKDFLTVVPFASTVARDRYSDLSVKLSQKLLLAFSDAQCETAPLKEMTRKQLELDAAASWPVFQNAHVSHVAPMLDTIFELERCNIYQLVLLQRLWNWKEGLALKETRAKIASPGAGTRTIMRLLIRRLELYAEADIKRPLNAPSIRILDYVAPAVLIFAKTASCLKPLYYTLCELGARMQLNLTRPPIPGTSAATATPISDREMAIDCLVYLYYMFGAADVALLQVRILTWVSDASARPSRTSVMTACVDAMTGLPQSSCFGLTQRLGCNLASNMKVNLPLLPVGVTPTPDQPLSLLPYMPFLLKFPLELCKQILAYLKCQLPEWVRNNGHHITAIMWGSLLSSREDILPFISLLSADEDDAWIMRTGVEYIWSYCLSTPLSIPVRHAIAMALTKGQRWDGFHVSILEVSTDPLSQTILDIVRFRNYCLENRGILDVTDGTRKRSLKMTSTTGSSESGNKRQRVESGASVAVVTTSDEPSKLLPPLPFPHLNITLETLSNQAQLPASVLATVACYVINVLEVEDQNRLTQIVKLLF